jgi:NADH-quinone oxidoreductase subunit K
MIILLGITALILFFMGIAGFLIRRNPLVMLMSIELMLNSVNMGLIMLGRIFQNMHAQVLMIFVIVVAAAEIVVGLAILVTMFSDRDDFDIDNIDMMKG